MVWPRLNKVAYLQQLRESLFAEVHLLSGLLSQHLSAIGHEQGSKHLSPVLLLWLRLFLGSFSEIID